MYRQYTRTSAPRIPGESPHEYGQKSLFQGTRNKNEKGQAAIEMGLALPFVVFLLYYTINVFHSIHTAHVGQRYAAMNVYERLDNRAMFVVDDVANQLIPKPYIAVQYTDDNGAAPRRRILLTPQFPTEILTTVGICREPDCK